MGSAFRPRQRLRSSREFDRVFARSRYSIRSPEFLILGTENDLDHHRLGVVVPKKHLRLATERNSVKRCIRESFRHLPGGEVGCDVVVLTRPGVSRKNRNELTDILQEMWRKLSTSLERKGP